MAYIFLLIAWLIPWGSHAQPLIIGTTPFSPPFEMVVDKKNDLAGFDIDLMQEICQRIDVSCQFKTSTFEQLFTDLLAGNTALAISSISITESRQADFLFSLPYLKSNAQFISTKNETLSSLKDLSDKKVGVERGTLFKALVLERYGTSVTVVDYSNEENLLQALASGDVDAIVLDSESAEYWIANNPDNYRLLGNKTPIGIGYGIMSDKKHVNLIMRINKALLDMEKDGRYLALYKRYFS